MKKTDKNFSDHELYDDVIHALKSPYIRLSDIKLRNEKTPAKKWSNKLSREISSGTHYYLTHECLDIILPSLKSYRSGILLMLSIMLWLHIKISSLSGCSVYE